MCHNIVDPFEDTESLATTLPIYGTNCHNIVDPFEDTERSVTLSQSYRVAPSHNIVDPFEDTESLGSAAATELLCTSHNIVDPFEDTESPYVLLLLFLEVESQHRRSVRGY